MMNRTVKARRINRVNELMTGQPNRWALGWFLGVFGAILIVIVLVLTLMHFLNRRDKVAVEVFFAPFISEVTLNGEKVQNNGENLLRPGDYEVRVVASDFETLTRTVTIKGGEKIYGVLMPTSERGTELARRYLADYLKVESLGSAEATSAAAQENNKYPLLSRLPVNLATYSLSYRYAEDGHPQIVLRADETYFNDAVLRLKELAEATGKSLAQYDVVTEGITNPFLEPVSLPDYQNTSDFVLDSFPEVSFSLSEWQKTGEYYYATLSTGSRETYNLATYRVILRWDGARLEFATLPRPVLTIYNTSGIPIDALDAINGL